MEDDESLNTFFLRFDRTAEAARFDEGQKHGMILARPDDIDNKRLKICLHADRRTSSVKHCRQENYSFEKPIKYLREADERLRLSEPIATKKAKVVKENNDLNKPLFTLKCRNCNNLGHIAHNCLLDACGGCRRFGCGHNWLWPKQTWRKRTQFWKPWRSHWQRRRTQCRRTQWRRPR